MIIYKDIFNGKELFTDAWSCEPVGAGKTLLRLRGKIVYEEPSPIDEGLIGGNKSAEADEPAATEDPVRTLKMPHLAEAAQQFAVKDYQLWLRGYVGRLVKRKKEEIAALRNNGDGEEADKMGAELEIFKDNITSDIKEVIISSFEEKDFRFYTADEDEYEVEGMLVPMTCPKDDPDVIFLYFIQDGLVTETC
ncbi:translationally-controlled tumor protein homolog [Lytechinus variegatus]|uniref:translationally-controlled tumor protein homolog n=1 Tax=Lytechinus variegatus TaxID=7654 RepID=UPI001BB28CF7|nr:translationally-controlled tumor protein homolog [Lytechinus variegatus]